MADFPAHVNTDPPKPTPTATPANNFSQADIDLAVAKARAEAFDDVAAIVRNSAKHGAKCETEAEWLQASYTFSNQAFLIRRDHGIPQPPTLPE